MPTGAVDGIIVVGRNFWIECPEHGRHIHQENNGHHSTLNEKLARDRFPHAVRKFVRSKLTPDDRRHFNKFCEGKSICSREDYERWKGVAERYTPEQPSAS